MKREQTIRGPAADLRERALFLVWGAPGKGARSKVFARELGIPLRFLRPTYRRGRLTAPFRYVSQTTRTLRLLWRRRPQVVFVQSPPTPAAMTVALYCALGGARFVVDAHSAAMTYPWWTRPRWLNRLVARRALATIVTNDHFAETLRGWGATALVVPDIPTSFPSDAPPFPVDGVFNVMVVNSFAPDEPLEAVVEAAGRCEDVLFYVTGGLDRPGARIPASVPDNVRFTGFLPDGRYHALMDACQAVACFTDRDHTMQRGACEALWTGTPILTSDWPILREYFRKGAVHVNGSADAIHAGVQQIVRDHGRYVEEIRELQQERRAEWEGTLDRLAALVPSGALGRATQPRRER